MLAGQFSTSHPKDKQYVLHARMSEFLQEISSLPFLEFIKILKILEELRSHELLIWPTDFSWLGHLGYYCPDNIHSGVCIVCLTSHLATWSCLAAVHYVMSAPVIAVTPYSLILHFTWFCILLDQATWKCLLGLQLSIMLCLRSGHCCNSLLVRA